MSSVANPILLDVSVPILTPRLFIRPPQAGDGALVNEAVIESFQDLTQWMPWAITPQTLEESETFVRTAQADWITRKELVLFVFERTTQRFLGATGFHTINWNIPSLEIGYWIRSSAKNQGIITESTHALIVYAFNHLQAARITIRCDEDNQASRRVAEKLGFALEGVLKNDERKNHSSILRNTALYARYDAEGLSP